MIHTSYNYLVKGIERTQQLSRSAIILFSQAKFILCNIAH